MQKVTIGGIMPYLDEIMLNKFGMWSNLIISLLGDTHRTQLLRVYTNISVVAFIAGLWLWNHLPSQPIVCIDIHIALYSFT
jgi:uncharacterized membrane protein YcfT